MSARSIALCGAGMISGAHLLAADRLGLAVSAVASRTRASANERAGLVGARVVDFDQLPAGADIVIVSTPPAQHADDTLRALDAGATVLLEKPMTRTLEEADRLVGTQPGHRLVYGENLAFSPIVREFLRRVAVMGPIDHLELRTIQSAPTWGGFLTPEWGGGALFDLGVHPLAIAVLVGRTTGHGEVERVSATLNGDTTDTHADVQLEFASGLRARLVSSWQGPEAGIWDVQASSRTSVVRLELRPHMSLEVNGNDTGFLGSTWKVPLIDDFGYTDQLSAVVDGLENGRASNMDVEFGRWILEIVCSAYLSAARNCEWVRTPSGCDRSATPLQLWRGR
jgi:predicted dehydrogenase